MSVSLATLRNRSICRLFSHRNFSCYFVGRSLSVVGDSLCSVVLIVAVLQSTHSVTSGAIVLLAGTVPVVLLTLIGGAVSDRLPRNGVMLASDVARCVAQLVMAALLLRPDPPLWALLVTQVCYGTGEAFFGPASTGILPDIVASDELPAANSVLQLSANSALVVGPALAGITVALAGAPLAIALDAISFAISAISLCCLRLPKRVPTHATDAAMLATNAPMRAASESMLDQLKTGFVELRRHRWVLVTTCYLAVLAFAFNGTMFVLGPAAALARLGGPSAWSWMLCAFGIGLIAGSLAALAFLRMRRPLGWAFVGNLGVVPMLVLVGTSQSLWFVVGSSIVAGIAVAIFSVTFPTLLQQMISTETLSRVGSYVWLARTAAMPIALALVGPLSDRFGFSAIFLGAALMLAIATVVSVSFSDIWSVHTPVNR